MTRNRLKKGLASLVGAAIISLSRGAGCYGAMAHVAKVPNVVAWPQVGFVGAAGGVSIQGLRYPALQIPAGAAILGGGASRIAVPSLRIDSMKQGRASLLLPVPVAAQSALGAAPNAANDARRFELPDSEVTAAPVLAGSAVQPAKPTTVIAAARALGARLVTGESAAQDSPALENFYDGSAGVRFIEVDPELTGPRVDLRYISNAYAKTYLHRYRAKFGWFRGETGQGEASGFGHRVTVWGKDLAQAAAEARLAAENAVLNAEAGRIRSVRVSPAVYAQLEAEAERSGASRAGGVQHTESAFTGVGGVKLFSQSWQPLGPSKGAFILVHGLKDHSGRYDSFARELVAQGYAVHAFDLRGHGRSDGARERIGSFDEYLDDLDSFVASVRGGQPGKPIYLFGHSMGGEIATLYTITRRPAIAGLVLSAPALKKAAYLPSFAIPIIRRIGKAFPSLPFLPLRNRNFSHDPRVRADMAGDPLIKQGWLPAGTAGELLGAIGRIQDGMESIKVPLLVMHGTADKITNQEGSKDLNRRAGSLDKTLKLYPELYHVLIDEPDGKGAKVRDDILRWLEDCRFKSQPSKVERLRADGADGSMPAPAAPKNGPLKGELRQFLDSVGASGLSNRDLLLSRYPVRDVVIAETADGRFVLKVLYLLEGAGRTPENVEPKLKENLLGTVPELGKYADSIVFEASRKPASLAGLRFIRNDPEMIPGVKKPVQRETYLEFQNNGTVIAKGGPYFAHPTAAYKYRVEGHELIIENTRPDGKTGIERKLILSEDGRTILWHDPLSGATGTMFTLDQAHSKTQATVRDGGVVQGQFMIPGEKSATKRFDVVRQPSGRIDFELSPAPSKEFQGADFYVLTPKDAAFPFIFQGMGPVAGITDQEKVGRIEAYQIRIGHRPDKITGFSLEFVAFYGVDGKQIGQAVRYEDFDNDRDVRRSVTYVPEEVNLSGGIP